MLRLPPNSLPPDVLLNIDENYRLRWCTLMSVDDMVSGIIQAIDKLGLLEETYILVTSDNGYHLGMNSVLTPFNICLHVTFTVCI